MAGPLARGGSELRFYRAVNFTETKQQTLDDIIGGERERKRQSDSLPAGNRFRPFSLSF